MAQEVTYLRKGDVQTFATGLAGLGTITVDHGGVAAEERNGLAKQLLASSALACYGSMLAATLEARDVPYASISGTATLELGPNKAGQGRVKNMVLTFTVDLPEKYADVFERCAKIMKNGCLVTGSMHEGFTVSHVLNPVYSQ